MLGGYKIIDLKHKDISKTANAKIEGIWDAIEGTSKATLLTGLNIGGTEYHDLYTFFIFDSAAYIAEVLTHAGTLEIVVSADDTITAEVKE